MSYRAATIREMLGGLYDLVTFHGSEADDLTPDQHNTIRRLYNEVKPYDKIREKFDLEELHAKR